MTSEHSFINKYGLKISLLLFFVGFVIFATSVGYTQRENRERIDENSKTAHALCDAAAGARDFWIKVRISTIALLTDPGLSPQERNSNELFKKALDEVIEAADGLAHQCDEVKQ